METLIDFSDIDFVVACRIDNHERGLNAFLVYNYFRGWSKNSHFIFVEDSITPALANYVPIDESDKIIYEKNEGAFRKCRSYNIGLKNATRPYTCFIDIDVILDPEQIFRVKNKNTRIGRNPKTKVEVMISSRNVVTFKVSEFLHNSINSNMNNFDERS